MHESAPIDASQVESVNMEALDQLSKDAPQVAASGMDEALCVSRATKVDRLEISRPEHRSLVRRVDFIILPLLCLTYGIQFLDRTALSYGSVMGMLKDLHVDSAQYSWLGSVFFFSYLAAEFPNARLMQSMPIGKYVGVSCVCWGISAAAFAASTNYASAVALRVLLGLFEACVSPAFTLIISQYYTKEEQSSRTAVWVSFSGIAQIFGGLIAYAIADPHHHYAIHAWKIVFIIYGCMTILIGAAFIVVIPRNPLQAWWMSPSDRLIAVERLRGNQQGVGTRKFKTGQLIEAFCDPFSWALFLIALLLDIPTGGLTNFFSQLIVSFGFTQRQSLLYGTPAGAALIVSVLAWGCLSHYFGRRLVWSLLAMLVSLLGALLVVCLPQQNRVGRLVGYYLTYAYVAALASMLSLMSSNVAGYTKKATVSSMFFVAYCVGNLIGPQTFRAKDAPHYVPAEVTIVVLLGLSAFDIAFMYWWLDRCNKKKAETRSQPDYVKEQDVEFMDLTDEENPEFVYTL